MNGMKSKGNFLLYYFPIVILLQTFTLLYGWVEQFRALYFLYLGIIIGLVTYKKYFSRPAIFALFIYVIVLFINVQNSDYWWHDYKTLARDTANLLLTGVMGYAIVGSKDMRLIKVTVYLFALMLIGNVIGTTIVETIIPGSIRAVTMMSRETGENFLTTYFRLGMANYWLPSGLVSIIPILVMGIKTEKQDKTKRILLLLVLISSLVLIWYSGSTTALLLGVLGLSLPLIVNKKTKLGKQIGLSVFVVIILIITFNDTLMIGLLDSFDQMVGHEGYFHEKVDDFKDAIMHGESSGDIETRKNLYQATWNAILENPIIGVNREAGSHSLILDHWGYLGLVGLIPFLFFVIAQLRMMGHMIPQKARVCYYESVAITVVMMFVKNTDMWEMWLCLFTMLPVFAVYCTGPDDIKGPNRLQIKNTKISL